MSAFNPSRNKKRDAVTSSPSVKILFSIGIILIMWLIVRSIINRTAQNIPSVYPDNAARIFTSKKNLISRLTELQSTITAQKILLSETELLKKENETLKSELGRNPAVQGVLAHVLTLPNRSFYNTITIDAGSEEGIVEGKTVHAFNSVAIGTISRVEKHNATVTLFSESGRQTSGTMAMSDVAVTLIGRGGGEYEVRIPRDMHFEVGDQVMFQSVHMGVLAVIEKIVTDPRDPFQRLLAKVPVNLQALKWVVVR